MSAIEIKSNLPRTQTGLSLSGLFSAACLFSGIWGSLCKMLGLTAFLPVLGIGFGVLLLEYLLRKNRFSPLIWLFLFASAMIAGIFFADLTGGFFEIINRISSVIGGHIGCNLAHYASSESGLAYACTLLGALLSLGCAWLVSNRSILPALLAALLFSALNIILDIPLPELWIALLAAAVLLLSLSGRLLLQNSKGGFLAWLLLACIICLSMAGGLQLLGRNDFPGIAALRTQIFSRIYEQRYGNSDSLPDGDFSSLSSLKNSDEVMLQVRMSEPNSFYLRGFVGSDYTGSGWKKASYASLSDHADLFYWLHQNAFYGQTQLAEAAQLVDESITEDDALLMEIRHAGASRAYVYSPYEIISAPDELIDPAGFGDIQAFSRQWRGEDYYTLETLPNQVKRYTSLLSKLSEAEKNPSRDIDQYLINESHYNAFVYSRFLNLPEDTATMLNELLGDTSYTGKHMDYGEAKQRILRWLEQNINYSETIAPPVEGNDFLEAFLTKTRMGFDVHYASATVAMMRLFGIPARYVEGYLITPEAAERVAPGETIDIGSTCAHAWAEIYQDGLGWIPFETAPKYLSLMEQADSLLAPESTESMEEPPQEDIPLEENSLDMEEDFHDDFEDDEELDEDPLPLPLFGMIAGILLALLLILLILLALARKLAVARINRSIRLSDRKQAVINLYSYLFSLMKTLYDWPGCVSPAGFTESVRADFGEDAAIKYKEVIRICEEAAFGPHGVLEADYQMVYLYVIKTRKLLNNRLPRRRKFRLRYVEHLY